MIQTQLKAVWIASSISILSGPVGAGTLSLQAILDRPFAPVVDVVAVPGTDDRTFVLNLVTGGIDIHDRSDGTTTPFLTQVEIDGAPLAGGPPFAANAYSVALSPTFASDGRFYVSVNTADKRNIVVEYTAAPSDLAGSSTVDPSTQRRIITIPHPVGGESDTHYGGALRFGPDGMLYLTTGDSDWPQASPETNPSQDRTNRLGAVLRIDPSGDAFPADADNNYAIPPGNPDFGPGADPALVAIGARNPFKIAFDPVSGALFIADVGEVLGDEISVIGPAPFGPANLGWPAFEGSAPLNPGLLPLFGDLVPPLLDVKQGTGPFEGFSLTGGVFYDGPIAELAGRYVFGDFGPGFDPTFSSPIWSLAYDGATNSFSDLRRWEPLIDGGGALGAVIGFGLDGDGTLYVSSLDLATFSGRVFAVTGTVAPVPLPAGGWLLVSGLVALVGLRRKARRV